MTVLRVGPADTTYLRRDAVLFRWDRSRVGAALPCDAFLERFVRADS